jgi:hypothetical protein
MPWQPDPSSCAAKIRDLLSKGFAPQAIVRTLDCTMNAVHVVKHHMAHGRRRRNPKDPRPPRAAKKAGGGPQILPPDAKPLACDPPVTVEEDTHLRLLRATVPSGYDRDPRSRDVDWSLALVWMRRNPPPQHRSAMP